ncbi:MULTISPECIES: DUF4245 domain-containing protein [Streptomyces]|uniref:DUF4245 domain-containing protein n=1 Tax=Streptomyces TaxID=1883 RepID=UPI0022490419|nr:DUF4245 domain-containing protein [Streptomyces sp. JHD 1]MCX2969109.1 DUF4245 domain-containing protein [Streptomyces sp. JHD 1]
MEGVATTRGKKTVRDMVLSMGLISLCAGVVYLFGVPHDEDQDPVREIDYRAELLTAERAAPYPLLAPEGLDERWRATSVYYRGQSDLGAVWHLGFHDPDVEYAAVEQSDGEPERFIADATRGAEATGATVDVDGAAWERYEGPKYDALVRAADGHTSVVTGTAPFERLAELARALEPRQGGAPAARADAG